jgi:hypothetical protein
MLRCALQVLSCAKRCFVLLPTWLHVTIGNRGIWSRRWPGLINFPRDSSCCGKCYLIPINIYWSIGCLPLYDNTIPCQQVYLQNRIWAFAVQGKEEILPKNSGMAAPSLAPSSSLLYWTFVFFNILPVGAPCPSCLVKKSQKYLGLFIFCFQRIDLDWMADHNLNITTLLQTGF